MPRTFIPALLAVVAGALATLPAHAALTPTGISCSGQGTGMTGLPGFLDCAGSFSGNNLNQSADVQTEILGDFGLTGLTHVSDITGSGSGTLSFALQSGPFVIALKAGDAFSLYAFAGGISSVAFDTLGVGFYSGQGKAHFGQDLSHADLYSAPVPEPVSSALMLVGLAAIGMARRRAR